MLICGCMVQIPGPADAALPLLRVRLAPSSGSAARQAPVHQALDAVTILAGHLEAWGMRSAQARAAQSLAVLVCQATRQEFCCWVRTGENMTHGWCLSPDHSMIRAGAECC